MRAKCSEYDRQTCSGFRHQKNVQVRKCLADSLESICRRLANVCKEAGRRRLQSWARCRHGDISTRSRLERVQKSGKTLGNMPFAFTAQQFFHFHAERRIQSLNDAVLSDFHTHKTFDVIPATSPSLTSKSHKNTQRFVEIP